jgi:peroxiredoxin
MEKSMEILMKCRGVLLVACMFSFLLPSSHAQNALPSFEATVLTGETVTEKNLLGQPSILIVTPSTQAAESTRQWVQALRKNVDPSGVKVRDVLALDLPFFISEQEALDRAKQKIPEKYHDQTWLLAESSLEEALNVPASSEEAYVFALNSHGQVVARVRGSPTTSKVDEIQKAVSALRN